MLPISLIYLACLDLVQTLKVNFCQVKGLVQALTINFLLDTGCKAGRKKEKKKNHTCMELMVWWGRQTTNKIKKQKEWHARCW